MSPRRYLALWALATCVALGGPWTASATPAEDDTSFDDDGFDDLPQAATATAPKPPSAWRLSGLVRSDQGLWLERLQRAPGPALPGGNDNPFAKARQSLDLTLSYKAKSWRLRVAGHGEFDFAYLARAAEYDAPTKRTYRQLLLLREAWLNRSWGPVELYFGRQIVAWGEGDGASVVDVVNPRDQREPGLADLNDVRVGVLATRLSWFRTGARGDHRLELIVVHETCNRLWNDSCFGLRTPPMGPFSPLPSLLEDQAAGLIDVSALLAGKELDFSHDRTQLSWANQQPMARWVYKGAGVDLGLYAASVLDQQGVIGALDAAALFNPDQRTLSLPLAHKRFELVGTSGAMTVDALLLKWELAFGKGRPFNVSTPNAVAGLGVGRSDTIEALGSMTWRGLADTTLGLEVTKIWLLDTPGELLFPADATVWSARVSHDALNGRLHMSAVFVGFGIKTQYGRLLRADVRYDVKDALAVGVAYVHYGPGDSFGPFSGLDHHDRLGVQLRWAFDAL